MKGQVSGLWPAGRCGKGHDLSVEGAWLYASNGIRECRACAMGRKRKKVPNTGLGRWKG